jgi:hypothetical protein
MASKKYSVILALGFFVALHVYVSTTLRLFPFHDLPNHLAAATIFRYYDDPSNSFQQYYDVTIFLRPNAFHFFFCGLDLFPSVEYANHIFYCLYILSLPTACFMLIKKLGGNPWLSLLSFIELYNVNVMYGFTGFTIAIPVAVFTFYFLLKYIEKNSLAWEAAVAFGLVALFFCHIIVMFFTAGVAVIYCALHRRKNVKLLAKDCCFMLPAILLTGIWLSKKPPGNFDSIIQYIFEYYSHEYVDTFITRGGLLFLDNFYLFDGYAGYVTGSFFSFFLIAPAVYACFFRKNFFVSLAGSRNIQFSVLLTVFSLILFLVLPFSVPSTIHFFYIRFSVFFYLGLIFFCSILMPFPSKVVKPAVLAVCLIHFFLWTDYFSSFSETTKGYNPDFFAKTVNSKRLAGLMYDCRFRGRTILRHFPDYYIVWKKGIASTFLIDCGFGSFGSTTRKAPPDKLPYYIDWIGARWVGKQGIYDGRYDTMDYILTRGEVHEKTDKSLETFTIINRSGKWKLYEKECL